MDMVSATATRRDVFAMIPAGLAAGAASDMTLRIPSQTRSGTSPDSTGANIAVRRHARKRIATKRGFARMKCVSAGRLLCPVARRCAVVTHHDLRH